MRRRMSMLQLFFKAEARILKCKVKMKLNQPPMMLLVARFNSRVNSCPKSNKRWQNTIKYTVIHNPKQKLRKKP